MAPWALGFPLVWLADEGLAVSKPWFPRSRLRVGVERLDMFQRALTPHAARSDDAGHQLAQSPLRLQPPVVAPRGWREGPCPATSECEIPDSIKIAAQNFS